MEFDRNKKKAIILTIIAILAIMLIFLVISILSISDSNQKNYNIDVSSGYTSLKELIESKGCKYVEDSFSNDREYPIEVKLFFKYDLYTDGESNEEFFTKLINDIAKFVRYQNIKLIDEEKDITIQVVCEENEVYSIVINGIEDYFIYTNSQMSISKYEEIKTVSLNPTAEVLQMLNENYWNSNIDCGTRDSIFKNYFIYFDEGIKYRKIGSTIYNIIFTENYQGEVIDNVYASDSINSVKSKLGNPTFEDKDLGIIGYKGNSFYAFFTGSEISIYRKTTYDYSEFWDLINQFVDEDSDMSFKEFMNELTYIWTDYSEYIYDSDYMFISYPNKGIDVKLNYDNESGIIVYNNISENLSRVQRFLENTEFLSKLQIDNVFEAERRRLIQENSLNQICDEFIENLKEETEGDLLCGESNLFKFYMDLDNNGFAATTYFVSRDGQYPNRELNEPIYSYVWINDNYLVYGIYRTGLYCYNVLDGGKQTLVEGTGEFLIKEFKDNIIYYDNQELPISF